MRRRIEFPQFTEEQAFRVPAQAWNAVLSWLQRNHVVAARGYAAERPDPDWAIATRWDGRQWVARLNRGCVNWRPAVISVRNQVTGQVEKIPVEEGPELALTQWRREESPPEWFARRWNFEPPRETLSMSLANPGLIADPAAVAVAAERGGWRTLCRCTVSVHVTRAVQTRIDVSARGGVELGLTVTGEGQGVAEVRAGVDPAPAMTDLAGLTGDEAATDSLPLATVWAVSPPLAGGDARPDETWQILVEQHVFYNLRHRSRLPETLPPPVQISVVPLRGDEIAQQLAAQLEREDSEVALRLAQARVEGRFWSV
jgi:hypothetical protein